MHWFSRTTVSIVLPSLALGCFWGLSGHLLDTVLLWLYRRFGAPLSNGLLLGTLMTIGLLLGFAVFGILGRLWPLPARDRETRCRKCGYILRGIRGPRCPECGERI